MAGALDRRTSPARPPLASEAPAYGLLLCAGILLLALVPRVVGLSADLPVMHHPDEPVNLRVIDAMITNGDPNPHFFNYPSLLLYLHAALHLDGPLLGWIPGIGELPPITQVMGVSYAPTTGSVLLHRGLTVGFGVLMVLVGWLTTRRLTTGLLPAAVTATLLALSPTLIHHSRLITPDVLAGLLVALTLLASVRLLRSGSWTAYAVAGVAVGLAASAKYNAVAVAVPVVLAALLAGQPRTAVTKVTKLPLAGACAIGAFLLTTPYALLDRNAFLAGLRFEQAHYATGHDGAEGHSLAFYAAELATRETVLTALALAGLIAVARHRRHQWRAVAVVASFPLVYGTAVSMQAVRNDRTMLLVLPALAVLAALAVEPITRWARDRHTGTRTALATVGAAAAVLIVVQAVSTLPKPGPSTWTAATRWVDAHAAPGSELLIETYAPWPDPVRYRVLTRPLLIDGGPIPDTVDYVIASEEMYGRYTDAPETYPEDAAAYRQLFRELPEVATFDEGSGPTIRVFAVTHSMN
ncbi:MAG: ArnT family glycosyltransferase [Pseudonocardiaceae bacterium]